ncbi:hypothetical protein [Lutibacter sp.]
MKKLTLILFLFSSLIGYSQKDSIKIHQKEKKSFKTSVVNSKRDTLPNSTQAQDWNSTRSNKTSKTARTSNPNGNTNNNNLPNSTQAQDWNSSRSNKTSKTARTSNPDGNNPPSDIKKIRKGATIGKWSTISQDSKRIGRGATIGDYATIGLSYGTSTPSSNFSDNGFAKNGNYFELSGTYYFSKFGIGVSVGQISSPTNENFSSSTNTIDLSTANTTQNWKQFYYGIGPEYKAKFGNFSAIFSTKIGLQSVKSINLESNYTNGETPIAILKIKSDKNTSLSYFSTGLKFGYNLSSNFSLYATANYMAAFSNGITISESKITDTNRNGIIDAEDLKFATGSATIDYEVSTKNIKPQSTNFGIGLSIEFGNNSSTVKRKRPGRTKYANITLKRNQANNGNDDKNNGTKAIDHNASRSNTTSSKINSKGNGNGENNTTRRGKRKAKKECLKNGGSFWESGDGSYHCMMPLSTAKALSNTSNELFRSKKRKCFKAGGKWVTNSHGSFCWNPSATSRVYGPGDAHYGHITVRKNKKQQAKVEVRGWDSKEKSTSKKGYDYYKATNKLDEDSDGDGLSNILKAEERKKKFKTKVKSTKNTARTGRNPQTGATIKGIAKTDSKGDGNNDKNNGTKAIDHNASRSNTTSSKIDAKGNGNDDDTARRGKRKAKKECLKSGGSFWESGDGSYLCMKPLSTAKALSNTNNKLFRSKKRKCFKAGGKWVTNSHGSFCWNPSKL